MKKKILIGFLIILMLMPIFSFNIPGVKAESQQKQFSSGFETGDTSEWDSQIGNPLPSVSTSYKHSGTYGCKFTTGENQPYEAWVNKTTGLPPGEFYCSAWMRFVSLPNYGGSPCFKIAKYLYFFAREDPIGTVYLLLRIYDVGEAFIDTFPMNSWHKLALKRQGNNLTAWVDDELKYQRTDSRSMDMFQIGISHGYFKNIQAWADDAMFRDLMLMSVSADLENVDNDGADWVFTNWKYYNFNFTLDGAPVGNASISFTVPTSWEDVNCTFFANSTYFEYQSNMSYETREGEPCLLGDPSWSWDAPSLTTTVIFPIWFQESVLDLWEPSDAIDIYGMYNSTNWQLIESSFFRIYSKGGFTLNTEAQNASHAWILEGGTPFSFHVEDGDATNQWMYNEIWYRDVQHLKLLPEIHFLTGKDGFDIKYGVDYSLGDGKWEDGWYFDINPETVHYNGLFTQAVWINMTCYFLARGGITAMEDLYMYNHGSITGVGDPGFWEIWVDLWVSDKNASSVGAGRLNAYEYAMEDNADLWLRWLANSWAPIDDVFKEFQGEAPLLAGDDSTILSSERVVMWRFWSQVKVYSQGAGQVIEVKNFEHFDATRSQQLPLTGISSPVFDETTTPVVGSKGLLGAIYTMFASIGSFLSENVLFGGLNLWGAFVGFLDTIAAMFGAPKFFTNLFNTIAQLLGYFVNSMSYIGTVLVAIFQLITNLMGSFLGIMGDLIGSLIDTFKHFMDMMGGAYGVGVDIWSDLGISTWLMMLMVFYPIYLIILWDEQGEEAVIKQLSWLFGILSWIFGFLVSLVQFVIGMITSIIESIPIAE